ncbi:MAG: EAL domain-containing protein [Proteobacteria bacterium]|nr:MAG: EAL domain-containing protein [Pseudomonadota bacterium]
MRLLPSATSSLSARISLVFSGCILATISLLVAVWYYGFSPAGLDGARDLRIREIIATQSIQADARINQLSSDLRERRGDLLMLASSPTLVTALADGRTALDRVVAEAFERIERAYPDRYLDAMLLEASTGHIHRAPSDDPAPSIRRPHWRDALLTPGVTEAILLDYDTSSDTPPLILARQILGPSGNILGALVLRMAPRDLLEPLARADETLLGPSGRIALTDSNGRVLARQGTPAALATPPPPAHPRRGIEGSFLEPRADGGRDITTYRYLPVGTDAGWSLAIRRHQDEAFEYIVDRRNRVLLLSLSLAALFLLLVRLFARRLTRKLRALTTTAERIAAGEAWVRVSPAATEGTEELARLARSFNHMAAQVDTRRQSLEIEVAERTRELAAEKSAIQQYLDVAGAIILVLDPAGRVQRINRIGCEILGRDEAALLGSDWFALCLPPRLHADVRAAFDALISEPHDTVSRYENPVLTARGEERIIAWANTLLRDPDGQTTAILASGLDVTEARTAAAALRSAHDLLHTVIDTSPDWIYAKDRQQRYILVNQAMATAIGQSPQALIGQPAAAHVSTAAVDDDSDPRVFAGQSEHLPLDQVRDASGRVHVFDTYKRPLKDPDGRITGLLAYSRDTTAQRRMEAQLRLWAKVFECSSEGVMITDAAHRILTVNRAFTEITGYTEAEAVGRTPRLLSSGRHDAAFYDAMHATLAGEDRWQGEIWNRRKNGEIYPQWLTINAVRDPDGTLTHLVGVFSDISDIKHSEARLEHLAHHDPLTGLPNRLLLLDRIAHSIEHARRHQHQLAVCFIDLDNFKHVNDSLGHHVGDALLKAIATELQRHVRSEDTLSRIGGDEFVLLVDRVSAIAGVEHIVHKLLGVLREPRSIEGHQLYLSGSIGISLFPQDGDDAAALIQHADSAMYDAKQLGKNRYRYYTQSLTDGALHRLRIESALREAALHQQLTLVYQPQVDLLSGALVGVEALLRWQHPQLGPIAPDVFIPIAEAAGLINEIGAWVLDTACQQLAAWDADGWSPQRMAVNVSVHQLRQADLPDQVRKALDRARLPASRLELEITESAIADQRGVETIHQLAGLGVAISIDDFGTGYSSLAYLKKLPIHTLKIDKSFVTDLSTDPNDEAIVRSVIALASDLGLETLAEGVETDAHRDFLVTHGCRRGQGYLFDRPMAADSLRQRYRNTPA